jgi:membrane protease YdiL (CAAX protease family)
MDSKRRGGCGATPRAGEKGWRLGKDGAQDMGMKRGIIGVVGFAGLWVLLTAALAPAVRCGVEAMAPGIFPFARIFGRVQLGVALALVPGLLFFWRQDPRRFLEGGRLKRQGLRMGLWAGLGMGMLGLVAMGQSGLGVRRWGGVPGLGVWLGAGGAGILVAVLEEFFFRGVLGLAWWRAMGGQRVGWLVGVGAVVFAGAHFLRPVPGVELGWDAGFLAWTRLELWAGAVDPWKLGGLFVAGLILGRMAWAQGTLAGPIGLHAGWVAGWKIAEVAWPEVPQATAGWWGPSLEAGPLLFLVLLVFALALWGRPILARLD